MKSAKDIPLFLLFLASVILYAASQYFSQDGPSVKDEVRMRSAATLSESWMRLIRDAKRERGLLSPASAPADALIGDEFTEMTTTLGSLEAKQISVNPHFAAVVVRWLRELEIDSTDVVLVASSGSFPGLAVSTLAALQVLNQRAVLMTSVGASSYGANQPAMTILDIEQIVQQRGGSKYRPALVTYGCDNDNGEGYYEGRKEAVDSSAARNGLTLWKPENLFESIRMRLDIAQHNKIALLINIGGNHAMIGNCPHALSLPTGLHRSMVTCRHEERGAIARISEMGIPVIHFLNIKELGLRFGIMDSHRSVDQGYFVQTPKLMVAGISLLILLAAIVILRKK